VFVLMPSSKIDIIIANLFHVIPIVRKKLMKVNFQVVNCKIRLTNLHVAIMILLNRKRLPVSEIAKECLILKPQMTRLIKELCNSSIVERQRDDTDKRVVNIALTKYGREILKQCYELFKDNIRKQLGYLNEKDLEELSMVLIKLRDIGSKWDEQGKKIA
jgi:DNA-binding MarR family transcriptional regulator